MSVLTFPYDAHYQPPMPVVDVEVGAPGRASLQRLVSALVDSGSDGTLIPVDLLGLETTAELMRYAMEQGWVD